MAEVLLNKDLWEAGLVSEESNLRPFYERLLYLLSILFILRN